jgi:hypothetical protein
VVADKDNQIHFGALLVERYGLLMLASHIGDGPEFIEVAVAALESVLLQCPAMIKQAALDGGGARLVAPDMYDQLSRVHRRCRIRNFPLSSHHSAGVDRQPPGYHSPA